MLLFLSVALGLLPPQNPFCAYNYYINHALLHPYSYIYITWSLRSLKEILSSFVFLLKEQSELACAERVRLQSLRSIRKPFANNKLFILFLRNKKCIPTIVRALRALKTDGGEETNGIGTSNHTTKGTTLHRTNSITELA